MKKSTSHTSQFSDLVDEIAPVEQDFVLERFPPYLMNRIMKRMNSNLKATLKAQEIGVAEWRVIAVLKVRNALRMSELSVYTMAEQSTLSRTVDRMEAKLLLRRYEDKTDARVQRIELSDLGQEKFDKIWPIARYQSARAFRKIDPEEIVAFTQTLKKILENVRENDII
ncbi:MarR family winged helix-turn-helix transcriptional regulator [Sneathiella aquimaris]|uniref:MarR family winged helix-turn-helix transcriptional regulator n=1 Tax=Sneathiella aquimaris TaxID=2599305 RepID=UPI00146B2FB5|nr:MarR family winged helix-turn-helix transcriptional regulator [Sneathiella aquimaris]